MEAPVGIVEIAATYMAVRPGDKFRRFGKLSAPAYLWYRKGNVNPITAIKVVHGEDSPGDHYCRLDVDLSKQQGISCYIWISTVLPSSPIIDVMLVSSDDPVLGPGFTKIPQSLDPTAAVKQYLCFKTLESQQKIDNAEYSIGDFVDALDTANNWLVGRILDIDPNTQDFFIHYEGWADKWNEWIPRKSSRLAPHRSRTKGKRTGWEGDRSAFCLVDDVENFENMEEQLELALDCLKQGGGLSDETHMFIVGENSKYIANLLSSVIDDPKLIPRAQQYFQNNIEIIIDYLKSGRDHNPVYITNLIRFFNGDQDCCRFYRKYGILGTEKNTEGRFAVRKGEKSTNADESTLVSAYLIQNINFFGEMGGFHALAKRLSLECGDPFLAVSQYIRALVVIRPHLDPTFAKGYIENLRLRDLVGHRLKSIVDDELKTLDKDSFAIFTEQVSQLLSCLIETPALNEFLQKTSLEVSLRLLKAEILEKRINGILDLQDTIDRSKRNYHRRDEIGVLSPQYLIKWLEDNKVVAILLDMGSHEQVIKRSSGILKFLAQHDSLTVEHIDLLWSLATAKHEDLVRIVYDTLADLAQALSEEHLDALYNRITERPLHEFQDYDLNFVKHFTINAVKGRRNPNKWYGLSLFWRMVQDDSGVSDEIGDYAATVLFTLLEQRLFTTQRLVYLDHCIEGLKKGDSIVQCLRLAKLIIHMYPFHLSLPNHEDRLLTMSDLIQTLEDKSNLRKLILGVAACYNYDARKRLQQTADDTRLLLPGQRHPHSVNITTILEFLDFILSYSNLTLQTHHVDQLWDIYVSRKITSQDPVELLQWLNSALIERRSSIILTPETNEYIFVRLLCNPRKTDFSTLSKEGFKCFETFFLQINSTSRCLLGPKMRNLIVIDHERLIGVDALWKMVEFCTVQEVATAASALLITLFIRIDFQLQSPARKSIFANLVAQTMEYVRKALQYKEDARNRRFLSRLVALLLNFMKRCEDGDVIKGPMFKPGDKVKATWKNNQKRLYEATVQKINYNGTYQLLYVDGDTDQQCPEEHIRPFEPREQRHDTEDHLYPHYLLSNDYFDLLFELLAVDTDIGRQVWVLLTKLPTNVTLESRIMNLSIKNDTGGVDWAAIFSPSSAIKLLYSLQIVDNNMNMESESRQVQSWYLAFVDHGGFEHIYRIFMDTPHEEFLAGMLPQRCLSLLLKLLLCFLSGPEASKAHRPVNPTLFVSRLLLYVKAITELACSSSSDFESGEPEGRPTEHRNSFDGQDEGTQQGLMMKAAVELIINCCSCDLLPTDAVLQEEAWRQIILNGLVSHQNASLRRVLRRGIFAFCSRVECLQTEPGLVSASSFFLSLLFETLKTLNTDVMSTTYLDFFTLLQDLLDTHPPEHDFEDLSLRLTTQIKEHPILEVTGGPQDLTLHGLMNILRILIAKCPSLAVTVGSDHDLVQHLYHSLFDVPITGHLRNGVPPPKCKYPETRKLAFCLLAELASQSYQNRSMLVLLLQKNHLRSHSGGRNPHEWNFEAKSDEKSGSGYLGMKNLGCICYMNAVLQQLFMIPQLRKNILSIDMTTVYKSDQEMHDGEVYQLQYMMASLQESEKQYYNPATFCHSFKDYDGNPTNVNVQEDSGGFLEKLVDKVSEKLKKTPHEKAFSGVIEGVFANELIGRNGCPHYKEREEEFNAVQLEIKNKKTLQESLNAFVEGELLEGSNQYNCSQCNKKVDTLKRMCIKKLPNTLVFVLKRFALDYNTLQTTKLNDQLEFPEELDMKPYTKEGLPDDGPNSPVKSHHPAAYYKYKLKGIVIHQGSATHGHYFSYIKERIPVTGEECRWYEFNDTVVRPFDPDNIPEECFGGIESHQQQHLGNPPAYPGMINPQYGTTRGPNNMSIYEKSRNAYLLFYDRISDEIPEVVSQAEQNPSRMPVSQEMFESISQSNLIYWQDRLVFDKTYFEFLFKVALDSAGPDVDVEGNAFGSIVTRRTSVPLEVAQLCTMVTMNTIARAADKDSISQWIALLHRVYDHNKDLCTWFLEMANLQNWGFDFLLSCNVLEVRQFVGTLMCKALSLCSEDDIEALITCESVVEGPDGLLNCKMAPKAELGPAVQFIQGLLQLLSTVPLHWKHFEQYFRVLAHFAELGPEYCQHLCAQNLLAKMVDLYLQDASPVDIAGVVVGPHGRRPAMGDNWRQVNYRDFLRLLKEVVICSETPSSALRPPTMCRHPPCPLSRTAKSLLLNKNFLPSLLQQATSRSAGNYVVTILQHLCWENEKLSQAIIGYVSEGLEEHFFDQLRPYFRVLSGLVDFEDSLQNQRIDWCLSSLLSIMEIQSRFWKITDLCTEHLIRMAKRNPICYKVEILILARNTVKKQSQTIHGPANARATFSHRSIESVVAARKWGPYRLAAGLVDSSPTTSNVRWHITFFFLCAINLQRFKTTTSGMGIVACYLSLAGRNIGR